MSEYTIENVTTADTVATVPTTYTVSTQNAQISNSSGMASSDNGHQTASFPTSPMAWYLLIIITLWLFCAIAATIIVVGYTKSLVGVTLFTTIAPPAYLLYWIVKRVFPEPENIVKLRIKKNARKPTLSLPK